MLFGLSSSTLSLIHSVFANTANIHRVRIFGSRALGRQREGSDIDLAIEGTEIDFNVLLDLRLKLENLQLPYRFDLVKLDRIEQKELREHIERVGKVIFEREN